ncbi:uncharacterized protein LOC141892077 isoform X2 [Acropora palmata]|uniref:uncharacterized protein LOC141892077 isoform X2 n=1 Tax=Acropora palmata TaxID=6131 RepID=UPI003DA19B9B
MSFVCFSLGGRSSFSNFTDRLYQEEELFNCIIFGRHQSQSREQIFAVRFSKVNSLSNKPHSGQQSTMQGSYFHHLFLLCIWLSVKVPQLGCDAVSISGQEDRAAANQCWQKCSLAANVSRSTAKAFESPETCYKECLKKSRNHQFAGNEQGAALSRRIKRASNMTSNSTQISGKQEGSTCLDYVNKKSFISKTKIHVGLTRFDQKFYSAKICWNISSAIEKNWTEGYMVIWEILFTTNCSAVRGMNKSTGFFSVNVTKEDDADFISVMVASLSQENDGSLSAKDQFQTNNFYEATPPSIPLTAENFCGRLLPSPRETVRPSQNTTTDAPTETVRTSQNTTTDAPTDHPKGKNLPIVPVVATCLTIAFVILVVAAVIWRCFVDKKKKEEDVALLDLGFKFDAFIIYSTTDEKWVKKKLLATLEKKHNIKCCIHYRDFLPGVPFVDNMAQSVYNSRKTIAVVSKSFLSSKYCNHELNIALHRLLERGDDSVIVIKLDDVEDSKLPIELQFRSYIDFTKANDKKAWEYKLVHSFGGERCQTQDVT